MACVSGIRQVIVSCSGQAYDKYLLHVVSESICFKEHTDLISRQIIQT